MKSLDELTLHELILEMEKANKFAEVIGRVQYKFCYPDIFFYSTTYYEFIKKAKAEFTDYMAFINARIEKDKYRGNFIGYYIFDNKVIEFKFSIQPF